jgi:dihydropteroate synthase
MPKLVGILNVTPDSFSDGGEFEAKDNALKHCSNLISQAADIIDIGAESTRPGATPIDYLSEWHRLKKILPDVIELCHKNNKLISLDSRHPQTIKRALDLGVDIVNDVSGGENIEIVKLAKKYQKKLVIMHNLGIPADKNKILDKSQDIVEQVYNWAEKRKNNILELGFNKQDLIFDIGIGFAKDMEQNIELMTRLGEFKGLDLELYVGHSRKSFLNFLAPKNIKEKDLYTALFSLKMKDEVDYLRLHNIALNKKLLEQEF